MYPPDLLPSSNLTSTLLGLRHRPTSSKLMLSSFDCVVGRGRDSGRARLEECHTFGSARSQYLDE